MDAQQSNPNCLLSPLPSLPPPDECPVEFSCVSSEAESDEEEPCEISSSGPYDKELCPLCYQLKKVFVCLNCLLMGDFKHSKSKHKYKFSDIKWQYLSIKNNRNMIIKECEKYTRKREKVASILDEINLYKDKIEIESKLKADMEQRITNARNESNRIEKECREKSSKWGEYRKRLDFMGKKYEHNLRNLDRDKEINESLLKKLSNESRIRILKLKETVFQLQEVDIGLRNSTYRDSMTPSAAVGGNLIDIDSDEDDDTVRSLIMSVATANASAASMYNNSTNWGRPEELVSTFGACYSITDPCGPSLPLSGDYSAYGMWSNKREVASGNYRNPAHVIEAALTYITQFVNLLAYFLDLRLPHRLSFSEFANGDLLGSKFTRKVAKLNANILHLAGSQGVPSSFLEPRRTISNLLLLFDPEVSNLGRRGPFEMSPQLVKSMEDSIEKDLVIYEEESSSDNDWSDAYFPSDWENVQRGTIDELNLHNLGKTLIQNMNPPMTSQMQSEMFTRSRSANAISSGGLLSSFSSLFKWK